MARSRSSLLLCLALPWLMAACAAPSHPSVAGVEPPATDASRLAVYVRSTGASMTAPVANMRALLAAAGIATDQVPADTGMVMSLGLQSAGLAPADHCGAPARPGATGVWRTALLVGPRPGCNGTAEMAPRFGTTVELVIGTRRPGQSVSDILNWTYQTTAYFIANPQNDRLEPGRRAGIAVLDVRPRL